MMGIEICRVSMCAPGSLGALAQFCIKQRPYLGRKMRQRDLLPLPLPEDLRAKVAETIDRQRSDDNDCKEDRGHKRCRLIRSEGIYCWWFLLIVFINYLWSPVKRAKCDPPPHGPQAKALEHLKVTAQRFVDQGVGGGPVIKSPEWDWSQHLKTKKVSYTGEVLDVAQKMTAEQVLAALPPRDVGAVVKCVDLCHGETLERLLDPKLSMKKDKDIPDVLPTPKVQASQKDWNEIGRALYQRGLVARMKKKDISMIKGKPLLAGGFGVRKPGEKKPKVGRMS